MTAEGYGTEHRECAWKIEGERRERSKPQERLNGTEGTEVGRSGEGRV